MRSFFGYERPDGRAGVRNHVVVLPSVSCANGVVSAIARAVPGVVPLLHGHGCGRGGRDLELHARTLIGLARHPNVAAVLVVGLGCEVIKAEFLAPAIAEGGAPVECLSIQAEGGSVSAARKGAAVAETLLARARAAVRTEIGLDRLVLGLECGGSDAFSGVTANPAVGRVADLVVEKGGTVLLTENTEMIGTSHILARRAVSAEVAERVATMVDAAERRTHEILGPLASMVIAPGNMDGGMTSIREKALGSVAKGGGSPVSAVIDYAEAPGCRGLVLMDAPGYDTESMTGLVAAGAQAILFTTGRGNPIGFPTAPVVKIATTTRLYESMRDDMDVNAGVVLEGATLGDVCGDILSVLARALDGEQTKAERNSQDGIVCMLTTGPSF